jgi:alpha-galactosidase
MTTDRAAASADTVVDEVPLDLTAARIYAEGWQSLSPATWYPAAVRGLAPEEDWQHVMRFRPGTPQAVDGVQAEGLLVVDPGTGEPARCYGAASGSRVPTLTATTDGDCVLVQVRGEGDADLVVSEHAEGAEAALAAYADAFAARSTIRAPAPPPSVWCSWYRYFEDVTSADVEENLAAFAAHDLAVQVVQIDDGWSRGLGEGLQPSPGFPSLPRLVDTVRSSGRQVGIWLAPFVVGRDTTLAREHPDWLVGDAGRNWGQLLVGLDLTHPGVRELLADSLTSLVAMGVSYLKLDFLYGGAVPGPRHEEVTATDAYRSGLGLVRETVGPDVYLLGCGAPILPSVGLVDAMRVSPDTFHEGGEDGSTGLRGLMPLAARAWQHGRFWTNDPDCLVARPSYALREEWATAVASYGGLRSCSDRVAELDDWGLETTRRLLEQPASSEPFDPVRVQQGAALAARELEARLGTQP